MRLLKPENYLENIPQEVSDWIQDIAVDYTTNQYLMGYSSDVAVTDAITDFSTALLGAGKGFVQTDNLITVGDYQFKFVNYNTVDPDTLSEFTFEDYIVDAIYTPVV